MAETPLPPGSFDTPRVSPTYVDGLPLDVLVRALDENRSLLAAQKASSERQFWSTPRRASTDGTRDVYEVSLNSAKKINAIAFDLARFPHKAYLFYRSSANGAWLPMKTKAKRAVTVSIRDSIPAVITPPPPGSTEHPQHYGAGHWVRHEFDLAPVTARQFRLVLIRQRTPSIPTDRAKKPVTYSLGVRGFEVGYKVAGRDDVPATPRSPVVVTERESFASTTDILGSPVEISVRENRASDLLKGATWKSEPQPIPNAVVNLFVDARDSAGQAQTIDRFYLDPVTSGVSLNLYYSNDTPDQTRFSASDNPLDFPLSRLSGQAAASASGLVFPDAVGYVDIDNAAIQFNPLRPFWLACSITPAFAATDPTPHPIIDTGTLVVEWRDQALRVLFSGEVISYSRPATAEDEESEPTVEPLFQPGQDIPFAVGFDGTEVMLVIDDQVLRVPVASLRAKAQPKTATGPKSYLRLGGYAVADDSDPGHGSFRLNGFTLKVEPPEAEVEIRAALASLSAYVVGGQEEVADTSDNALVRYLPAFQTPSTGLNPLGFIGGVSNRYEDLVWTPVNRDFRVAKGFIHFNPTLAKYFKFEFTNLAPAPYDDYSPVTRKVKVFPTAQVYRQAVVTSSSNTAGGAVPAAQAAAGTMFFSDQARLYSLTRPVQPNAAYIPTQAVYSTDPQVAATLRQKSVYLNLQAWHARRFVPRFVDVQKHVYETVEVQHTQRVAYFVALSRVEMYRVNYLAADDTEQYLEPFSDGANLVVDDSGQPVGGWSLEGGFLSTPTTLGVEEVVQATSEVFASQRKVTGLQFATQQTPPVQLLVDPDLDDEALLEWRSYGDARITPSAAFATDIGTMALVERDSSANYWNTIEQRFRSWDEIEADETTWDDLENSGEDNPQGGIAAKDSYAVSTEGRLYGAARVYAISDLRAPLYVQIVTEDGRVLSEEQMSVKAGQVVEAYTSYTIGEGGSVSGLSWDEVEALGDWDTIEDLGTWDQVSQTAQDYEGRVSVQVVQSEPTADAWYVDNISLFDDAIVWEFSNDGGKTFYPVYDIRNDPRGAFMFPPSTDESVGRSLVWRVRGSRGDQRVDYLALRPLYDSLPLGQPYRETIQAAGPNLALVDHYPAIEDDPRWKVWNKPIPEEWWFTFRQWLLDRGTGPEDEQSIIVVPNSIVPVPNEEPVEPEITPLYASSTTVVVEQVQNE